MNSLDNNFKDYVIYIDTDSLFIDIYKFIENMGYAEYFNKLEEDDKVIYIDEIAKVIENYVNDKSFNVTQIQDFNSQERKHKLVFKNENVFKSSLFIKKKKYLTYSLMEEGYKPINPLTIKGLEVVRSDTPQIIKPMLKEILHDILVSENDDFLNEKIKKFKQELCNVLPEEIAQNLSANNLNNFINNDLTIDLGTPMHIKGVINYKKLIKFLDIEHLVENIESNEKCKVVYLKPNKFGFESFAFLHWNKEFNNHIEIDYDKMINKNFINKIEPLLKVANKNLSVFSNNFLEDFFNFE